MLPSYMLASDNTSSDFRPDYEVNSSFYLQTKSNPFFATVAEALKGLYIHDIQENDNLVNGFTF